VLYHNLIADTILLVETRMLIEERARFARLDIPETSMKTCGAGLSSVYHEIFTQLYYELIDCDTRRRPVNSNGVSR
jgi:hypothetical protein